MSLSPEQIERVEYLLTVFGDESISQDEMAELNTYIIEHPEARKLYFADTYLCNELQEGSLSKSISSELRLQAPRQRKRQTKRKRKSSLSMWSYMAAAIAATFLIVFFNLNSGISQAQQIQVADLLGTVSRNASGSGVYKAGDLLKPNDQVYVAEDASCRLVYTDGTYVRLSSQTQIKIVNTSTAKRNEQIELLQGRLQANVKKQQTGKHFTITSRFADVRVLGTQFDMQVDEIACDLKLNEGRVEFSNHQTGRVHILEAGDSISTRAPDKNAAQGIIDLRKSALAIYPFTEGSGTTVNDHAQRGQPLHLSIGQPKEVQWLPGKGLQVKGVAYIHSAGPAQKLNKHIQASRAFTILLHLQSSGVNPNTKKVGMDRIFTLSDDFTHRNLSIGMGEIGSDPSALSLRLRRGDKDINGLDASVSEGVDALADKQACKIAIILDAKGSLKYWINGKIVHEKFVNHHFNKGVTTL